MYFRNVHRRSLPGAVAELLDHLGGSDDRLSPGDRWSPLRLDRLLQVGARGGHGPIPYWVELYEPGQPVESAKAMQPEPDARDQPARGGIVSHRLSG